MASLSVLAKNIKQNFLILERTLPNLLELSCMMN